MCGCLPFCLFLSEIPSNRFYLCNNRFSKLLRLCLLCFCPALFFRRFGSEIPRENACLVVFALGTVAVSRSARSAASLMSGFGQLLRQASNGSVSTLLQLSKGSTISVRFHPGTLIQSRQSLYGPPPPTQLVLSLIQPLVVCFAK